MIRVMIVEDQKLVRSLLESYIQNEDGYQLAVSIPGAAAVSYTHLRFASARRSFSCCSAACNAASWVTSVATILYCSQIQFLVSSFLASPLYV